MAERAVMVLVDFDNFFPDYEIVEDADPTPGVVDGLVRLALDRSPDATEVNVRLYGGWLDNGTLTQAASALEASVGAARFFPRLVPHRRELLRGSVVLAYSLIELPSVRWQHTRRASAGLPRARLTPRYGDECALSEGCPLRQAHWLSRKRRECPMGGCHVSTADAFETVQQKMVDAMMICDILGVGCVKGDPPQLLVLSNDLDLIPAVALAQTRASQPIHWVRPSFAQNDLYEAELSALGAVVSKHEI